MWVCGWMEAKLFPPTCRSRNEVNKQGENFNLIFLLALPRRVSIQKLHKTNNKNQLCYEKKVNNESGGEKGWARARNKAKEEKTFN